MAFGNGKAFTDPQMGTKVACCCLFNCGTNGLEKRTENPSIFLAALPWLAKSEVPGSNEPENWL